MSIRSTYFFLFLVLFYSASMAQSVGVSSKSADTLKTKADTGALKKKLSKATDNYIKAIKAKQGLIKPINALQQGSGAFKDIDSKLTQGLKKIEEDKVKIGLDLEDATQYQPLPPGGIAGINSISNPKFLNKFSVKGNITAWGIPLNFNFTNDQNNLTGLGDVRNSLFKFDYSPSQLNNLLKSDLQQYYDVRKNAFAGLDLTEYTQATLKEKIKTQSHSASKKVNSNVLTEYISKPENVTGLLTLNEDQIRKKLKGIVEEGSQSGLKSASGLKNNVSDSISKIAQSKAISDLSNDKKLNQYFKDPKKVKELKYMTEEQINQKLTSLTGADSVKKISEVSQLSTVSNVSTTGMVTKDQTELKSELIKKMSREIFLSRVSDAPVKLSGVMDKTKLQFDQNSIKSGGSKVLDPKSLGADQAAHVLSAADKTTLNSQIDSVALTITDIKAKLKNKGIDVGKLLAMQKATNDGNLLNLDNANDLLTSKPHNAVQSFFTRVQALKIGSFGNNVPGSTKGDDLFLEGTHLTYKVGVMPITLGYGNVNDIVSAKDVNYQASDYNTPKSVSYLSLKVKDGTSGSSTFSIIGSGINHTNNYNNYAVPSSSSNNVALTISKFFNAGDLGKFTLDVSKSTTLAYQDLTPDANNILDKKAGLDYSGSNLTQSLAFGFNHELDVKTAGLTEAAYFNYSGSGYQNPGNNGFGGGGLKMGGNVKKTLFKNKLSLSLRTDLNDKSISYTNNDKWKTYQIQLDSRYNITKKFNVSLKYLNGGTDKQVNNTTTPVYTSQKYQVDGNLSYKIGKNYTLSHLTIGKQDYSNVYITTASSNLLMINYTQSIILRKNSLTLSTFYNKELSTYKLIGDLLNSDLTYQYTIFQKVNLSTAATYLDNTGIARQTGIRQSIQLLAGKNFDVDTYVDLRHNVISPLYPDLYAACRAELSLKYHIKY